MRNFLTSVALCLMPSFASAEIVNLTSHGNWDMNLFIADGGGMLCNAITSNRDLDLFAIRVDEDGFYDMFVDIKDAESEYEEFDFVLFVGGTEWTLRGAEAINTDNSVTITFGLGYSPDHKRFVSNVMHSDRVVIRAGNTGNILATFSLTGSSRAIQDLDVCRERIKRL